VTDSTTKKPKINIRNWECGVVIPVPLSALLAGNSTDDGAAVAEGLNMSVFDGYLPVPMIVPGEAYQGRRPWFYNEQ
jgi:Tyrosyl-DNA phosphodiesterase